MNYKQDKMKLSAMVIAVATILSSPAFASSGADAAREAGEECKQATEAPLIVVSPEDKAKLNKGQVVIGTQDKPNGRRWVTAKIRIDARPSVVWEAVHAERKTDPDLAYSKVVEGEGKAEQTIEQKFQLIPIVGTSVCLIKCNEVPNKRIDYYLLKSDRFKAVEGSWILQPTENGGTILELASYIDMGVPAPRAIIEGIAGKKLASRVTNVRRAAEDEQKKVANKLESRTSN